MDRRRRESGVGVIQVRLAFQPTPVARRKREQHNKLHPTLKPGKIPRISRLMALAIKLEGIVERGEVRDYADLARLGYVTRARMTQIMNLLNLAPDIQEEILFLPRYTQGRAPITEHQLRPLTVTPYWNRQRRMWAKMVAERLTK